jgi:ectoine hydroxylase-related dioxygenase (phytanoyl-CoA dioxygenase family)
MLDAFTDQNGPTRIVPGTHRSAARPQDALEDPEGPHPDEITITGRAGTVAVFNAHVWHGGTRNATTGSRHAITMAFCRRQERQQYDIRGLLRPETYARLNDATRYLLDV